MAFLRSSEEDVYYRIDSICTRKGGQHGVARNGRDGATTPFEICMQTDSQSESVTSKKTKEYRGWAKARGGALTK